LLLNLKQDVFQNIFSESETKSIRDEVTEIIKEKICGEIELQLFDKQKIKSR
jgi:hypothetical protein